MHKYLEDVATSDVAFEVETETLDGLFAESAKVLSETMVDPGKVEKNVEKLITSSHESIEQLLHDFLSEITYYKDAEQLVFSDFDVEIKEGRIYGLSAVLKGDIINPEKHELRNDVKAVTYHQFTVKKKDKGWYARVILDI